MVACYCQSAVMCLKYNDGRRNTDYWMIVTESVWFKTGWNSMGQKLYHGTWGCPMMPIHALYHVVNKQSKGKEEHTGVAMGPAQQDDKYRRLIMVYCEVGVGNSDAIWAFLCRQQTVVSVTKRGVGCTTGWYWRIDKFISSDSYIQEVWTCCSAKPPEKFFDQMCFLN